MVRVMDVPSHEIASRILELKKQRNAVILAHNYQLGEIQDVADFIGDSLELSRKAAATEADVIVFCGVHFMAETAAILCPEKIVLMPDVHAGCPMANMVTVRELRKTKEKHPDAVVVTYVNSTAAVKAESDICCTSGNALKVVQTIPSDKKILFVPDRHLGDYISRKLGRPMILWPGYCPTHQRILPSDIQARKKEYPGAKVVVHPECVREVIEMADQVASTSGILKYARETNASEFIIGTEIGIIYRLQKDNPGKKFIPASPLADCSNMKLNTLEKVLWSLEDMETRITVEQEIARKARSAIDRMLAVV